MEVALGPSRALALALTAGHVGALACLVPLTLPAAVKVALALAVLASLARSLRREAWRSAPDAVTRVRVAGASVRLELRDGRRLEARVAPSSVIAPGGALLALHRVRAREPSAGVAAPAATRGIKGAVKGAVTGILAATILATTTLIILPDAAAPRALRRLRRVLRAPAVPAARPGARP